MRTQSSVKIFGLSTAIFLLVPFFTIANSQNVTCPIHEVNTSSCSCDEVRNKNYKTQLKIQCPLTEPRLVVHVDSSWKYITFECFDMENEYELLPKLKFEKIEFLYFRKCRFPRGKSLSLYLENFHIEGIQWLLFSSDGANHQVKIEAQHFEGFSISDIEVFVLHSMEIENMELAVDVFEGMKKLTILSINVTNINLPLDLFAPLAKLDALNLSGTKIRSLDGILKNQRELRNLFLQENELRNLTKDNFIGIDSLAKLDLSSNGIESLDPDVLFHLTNLQELTLSANHISTLPKDFLRNQVELEKLDLTGNQITQLDDNFFLATNELYELKLSHNKLTNISKKMFSPLTKLTLLHLDNNMIAEIDQMAFQGLEAIESIALQSNQLRVLQIHINHLKTLNKTIKNLTLSGNPWSCDCNDLSFTDFIHSYQPKISDFINMTCQNGHSFNEMNDLCKEKNKNLIIIASIAIAVLGLILGGLAAFYYKYQKQIEMWLYSHNLCLRFVTEEDLDEDKRFDAFVSYSHQDSDFVADYLVRNLEKGPVIYKLCLHERDWRIGVQISTQISNSVNDSKRTIIVLSPHFLQSSWGRWEFTVAQSHAATERRSRLIIILYGDIGDINNLEPEIRDYLRLITYLKWGDKWFWEKLRYAMPHVRPSERVENSRQTREDGNPNLELQDLK